ncbi:MAG TPA: hypothetical protein VMC84_05375 [Methanocella sp.]|uniref:hypothetical protein n=1 Tax=Methanocella sp. TaxID=2052833 RepID=UPI002C286AE2|nr:hypothetical protein [Methanocella sp.]HTY90590.1 hypothetical protein [Methanocella sp.]
MQAQTSPIAPNGIAYLGNETALASGASQNITVQILYNGGPLKSEGVRVYFQANDTSIIPVELGTFVLTDANGVATYTAIANHTGNVKLTATAMSVSSGVSANKIFQVTAGPAATPTPIATATPTPSATVTATPTTAPAATPTTAPTTTPAAEPANSGAQATGIIVTGIVLAIVILIAVALAQMLRKK